MQIELRCRLIEVLACLEKQLSLLLGSIGDISCNASSGDESQMK